MRTAVTHQRVSNDVSADRVNRVNREQHDDRAGAESAGSSWRNGGQVWRNIGSLRALLARAERELAREPGAYVAVAVVHGDKREEQAGRWGWAGSREAGGQVAAMGARVAPGDRGLRVRVHREGGGLIGSTLLRRTVGAAAAQVAAVDDKAADAGVEPRLAALEAKLAQALVRIAAQDREIAMMQGGLARVEHLQMAMGNMHSRLDAVEAVCERVEAAEAMLIRGEADSEECDGEHEDGWDDET